MTNGERFEPDGDNCVFLRGRLAAEAEQKELPSGDLLIVFRLTVSRPPGERVRVDSLECTTTRRRAATTVRKADPGDLVEVSGSLRRRFWRSPAGPTSRYAVDVESARVVRSVSRPGRQAGAARDPKQASA